MTSDSFLAVFTYWFVLSEWMLISLVLFFDCFWVYGRTRRTYLWALRAAEGRKRIAMTRLAISRWFLIAASCALFTVLLAAYNSVFVQANYEAPSILSVLTQQVLILMLFAFWRAKRNNVYQIKAVEAREKVLKEQIQQAADLGSSGITRPGPERDE